MKNKAEMTNREIVRTITDDFALEKVGANTRALINGRIAAALEKLRKEKALELHELEFRYREALDSECSSSKRLEEEVKKLVEAARQADLCGCEYMAPCVACQIQKALKPFLTGGQGGEG